MTCRPNVSHITDIIIAAANIPRGYEAYDATPFRPCGEMFMPVTESLNGQMVCGTPDVEAGRRMRRAFIKRQWHTQESVKIKPFTSRNVAMC